jgi:hypothetical protein
LLGSSSVVAAQAAHLQKKIFYEENFFHLQIAWVFNFHFEFFTTSHSNFECTPINYLSEDICASIYDV